MAQAPLTDALELAATLARAAAKAAMVHYRPDVAVDYKGGDRGDPVTQADRDANAVIVAGIAQRFPGDAILAEESYASHDYAARADAERLWCIDPIDGTREFVAHSGHFAVMIGLAVAGQARLGVVYHPTERRLFAGLLREDGAHLAYVEDTAGRRPLVVTDTPAGAEARMVVSRSWRSRGVEAVAAHLGIETLRPLGSVGLKMAAIATGDAELYVSPSCKTHEWDTCGPEAILRAAGGTVTSLTGCALQYNKRDTHTACGVVGSNGAAHAAALAAVHAVATERRLLDEWRLRRRGTGGAAPS
jgi:3'(2'), 5'-bisphosphate nucleotidase